MNIESSPEVYEKIGNGYKTHRQPDPRIASQIWGAIGDAKTVCNVGAGTGSYEPPHCEVTAVEPSTNMIRQRTNDFPVVQASAEDLPFGDGEFDAAMALLTVHHWVDAKAGLLEMKRISNRQIIFTFVPELVDSFWLVKDYIPEIVAFDEKRAIRVEAVADTLNATEIKPILVPWDCTDGFQAAYWRRPEFYLRPDIRAAISTLAQLDPKPVARGIAKLEADILSGRWHETYADLLSKEECDFGYRLVIA